MIYSFRTALDHFGSRHKLYKAISDGKLFRHSRNVYSDNEYTNELEVITKRYPYAVFTSKSAYYFYQLTDVIPTKNYLAIEEHVKISKSEDIVITYMKKELHQLGVTNLYTHNALINIYDREKLLIELVRNKNKFGYAYYKEIVNNYRDISSELDIDKLSEYLGNYKNRDNIYMTIKNEVF